MKQYDIVIIGAGLGGMLCGVLLAKEGFRVGIIEKNKQVGGCLQSFSFDKKLFDSCVHYIGSVSKGKNQYKIFDYAEVLEQIELSRYNQDCFDAILIGDDPTEYPLAQGYDNFVLQLSKHFPHQQQALQEYIRVIRNTLSKFPLYALQNGDPEEKLSILDWKLKDAVDEIFTDEKLKKIILGNAILYNGVEEATPFYIHALVCNSYMEGAYKVEGSSAQIAKALWKTLQKYKGEIIRNETVERIVEEADESITIYTNNGNSYKTGKCISNIHPKQTLEKLESNKIKKVYKKRIDGALNSQSMFMVNIILEPETILYKNYNVYWCEDQPLETIGRQKGGAVNHYAMYFTKDKAAPGYAENITLLTYMDISVFGTFTASFNTTNAPSERNKNYTKHKEALAQQLIDKVSERFPEIKASIRKIKVATPLTFRDYMGTDDGSVYGILADARAPLSSQISVQTKVPNLLLTGQNVNVHGVLGVSITAVSTCAHILGLDYLLNKINTYSEV